MFTKKAGIIIFFSYIMKNAISEFFLISPRISDSVDGATSLYGKVAIENLIDPNAVAEVPYVKVGNDLEGMKTTIKKEYSPIRMETLWEWNPQRNLNGIPQMLPYWQAPMFTKVKKPHVPPTSTLDTLTDLWPRPSLGVDSPRNIDRKDKDNRKIARVYSGGLTEWHTTNSTSPLVSTRNDFASSSITTNTPTTTLPDNINRTAPSLPTLEEFLKSQYETTTRKLIDPKSVTSVPTVSFTQTPPHLIKTVNINDLPIVYTLNTGTNPGKTIFEVPKSGITTQTRTLTKTPRANDIPKASDLDQNVNEFLERVGIRPKDILISKNGTFTKAKFEPDGIEISTTYRRRTVATDKLHVDSSSVINSLNQQRPYGPFPVNEPSTINEKGLSEEDYRVQSHVPHSPGNFGAPTALNTNCHPVWSEHISQNLVRLGPPRGTNPIDAFLDKVNLTAAMITTSSGEIIKTILDDEGRVLTASFVLSTVQHKEKCVNDKAVKHPIK